VTLIRHDDDFKLTRRASIAFTVVEASISELAPRITISGMWASASNWSQRVGTRNSESCCRPVGRYSRQDRNPLSELFRYKSRQVRSHQ
jgi:hypothetical protein